MNLSPFRVRKTLTDLCLVFKRDFGSLGFIVVRGVGGGGNLTSEFPRLIICLKTELRPSVTYVTKGPE